MTGRVGVIKGGSLKTCFTCNKKAAAVTKPKATSKEMNPFEVLNLKSSIDKSFLKLKRLERSES